MLYIENIDDNSIRFGSAVGGGTYNKVYPKTLQARKDEIDRIWIWHTQNNETVLDCYLVSNISLEGTVYSTAEAFVKAFNNLTGGSISGSGGSLTSSVYNTPDGGEVTGSSLTIAANTIQSITLTCTVGTAVITVGTSTINMSVGQTISWSAGDLLDTAIKIDTTADPSYSVDYHVIGPAPTTTTTTAATTTTTTAAVTTTTTTV